MHTNCTALYTEPPGVQSPLLRSSAPLAHALLEHKLVELVGLLVHALLEHTRVGLCLLAHALLVGLALVML